MRNNKGFTLIEAMIIIAIIGILIATVLPVIKKHRSTDAVINKPTTEYTVTTGGKEEVINKKHKGLGIVFLVIFVSIGTSVTVSNLLRAAKERERQRRIEASRRRYINKPPTRYGNTQPMGFYDEDPYPTPKNDSFGEVVLTFFENIFKAIMDAILFKDKRQNNSELDKNPPEGENRSKTND